MRHVFKRSVLLAALIALVLFTGFWAYSREKKTHAQANEQAAEASEATADVAVRLAKARHGDAESQTTLCLFYSQGWEGLAQDYAEAIKWCHNAANQGDAGAQGLLGDFYFGGTGVPKDYTKAASWYHKSAEQGNAKAESMLGLFYAKGFGVAHDDAQAAEWSRKAAEQGVPEAQALLGLLYDTGAGVKQNPDEAIKWYRRAAEQGLAEVQTSLGLKYSGDLSTQHNREEALFWLLLGAASGDSGSANAEERRFLMSNGGFTPQQISDIQARVREWKPTKENK